MVQGSAFRAYGLGFRYVSQSINGASNGKEFGKCDGSWELLGYGRSQPPQGLGFRV